MLVFWVGVGHPILLSPRPQESRGAQERLCSIRANEGCRRYVT